MVQDRNSKRGNPYNAYLRSVIEVANPNIFGGRGGTYSVSGVPTYVPPVVVPPAYSGPSTVLIVFEGDSITASNPPDGTTWASQLVAKLPIGPTYTIKNIATAGYELAVMDDYFNTRAGAAYDSSFARTILCLLAGTNNTAETTATKYAKTKSIVTKAKAKGYQSIIVGTVLPRATATQPANYEEDILSNLASQVVATGVSDIGADYIINFRANSAFANKAAVTTTNFQSDFLHPNNAGCSIMSNIALPVFQNSIVTPRPIVPVVPVPVNSVLPVVSGSAVKGQTLNLSTGTWSNSPTEYFYQWYRGSTIIANANLSTYTLVDADVTNTVYGAVIAKNAGGNSIQANSVATAAVTAPAASAPAHYSTIATSKRLMTITPSTLVDWTIDNGVSPNLVTVAASKYSASSYKFNYPPSGITLRPEYDPTGFAGKPTVQGLTANAASRLVCTDAAVLALFALAANSWEVIWVHAQTDTLDSREIWGVQTSSGTAAMRVQYQGGTGQIRPIHGAQSNIYVGKEVALNTKRSTSIRYDASIARDGSGIPVADNAFFYENAVQTGSAKFTRTDATITGVSLWGTPNGGVGKGNKSPLFDFIAGTLTNAERADITASLMYEYNIV